MKRKVFKAIAMLMVTAMLLADLETLKNDGTWFTGIISSVQSFISEKISEITRASAEETVYYTFLMGTEPVNDGGVIDYSLYSTSDRSLSIGT